MKEPRNRHGRKGNRWTVPLLAAAAVLAIAPVPAGAMTGGAAPSAPIGTSGGGTVFSALRPAGATWYGPGLYGRHTACGQLLQPQTVGVANRDLPCGTAVKFVYHGHQLVTTVIDRGPYSAGFDWDLTNGARRALGFEGAGTIRYAVALGHGRG
jgi:Lytic transglycolase